MFSATPFVAAVEIGGYINLFKLLPVPLIILIWGKLLTWADKDAPVAHLPREVLNTVFFFVGMASFFAFFFIPGFWVALAVLVGVFLASAGTYLGIRHQKVGLADLKTELAELGKNLGKSGKQKKVKAGQIGFLNHKGAAIPPPESAEDPDRAGYETAQSLLLDPMTKWAERVEVRPGEGAAEAQYVVDGVAYNMPAFDKAGVAAAITYLKQAAGLDVEDRRKPQTGNMRAMLNNKRHDLEIMTRGSTAGESLRVSVDLKKRWDQKLETIGFTSEQLATVQGVMMERGGIVLVTAPKQQGLTTLLYCIMRKHDAFMNHIQTIEHSSREDLEGITQNNLAASVTPADELKQVEWVCSQEPDLLMVDEIANPASARELIRFAAQNRRVYLGMRYGSSFDALAMWRRIVGDDELAMSQLRMIIAGRVMRRLCMACKVAYVPEGETLRKLNMDPARVQKLFQARTQPLRDQKGNPILCEFCQELRYKGRFGVYEVFPIDDEVRQTASTGGSIKQLQTIFRKQRGRYLQEMALAQVEAGETSVQEVLRVLRGPEQQRPAAGARPAR